MDEKRFTVMKKFDGSYVICDKGKMLVADDCCDLLNEQQATIKRLERRNKQLKEEIEPLKQKAEVLNKIWRTYLENHK